MTIEKSVRRKMRIGGLLAGVGLMVAGVAALGSGQSFTSLATGYQQEIYGATQMPADDDGLAMILGGVAFAPDGDVWSADCVFGDPSHFFPYTRLHRFDSQTTAASAADAGTIFHPEVDFDLSTPDVIDPLSTRGGCGLTNHPDTFIYSNSAQGVFRLDSSTGLPVAWPFNPTPAAGDPLHAGPPGNALGITVDPRTSHVIYAGAGCHPTVAALVAPTETDCKIQDLNTITGVVTNFAVLSRTDVPFVDGVYFDPTGTYLFMANRGGDSNINYLTILRRPEDSVTHVPPVPQIAQSVPLANEPDGVAFSAGSQPFVVTNDEENNTMTRFDFAGGDFTTPPAISTFASGGFRGDLLNVGPDGCVYATQGRHLLPDDFGTRYDNGTETTEDSIVRICSPSGGFTPGPGVPETVHPPTQCTGVIGDFVWLDLNNNGIQEAGEPGISGVTLTLKDSTGHVLDTTTTDANGAYAFSQRCAGSYTVEVSTPTGYAPTLTGQGAFTQADSNVTPANVTLTAASGSDTSIDFGFVQGTIAGFAYSDLNHNGTRDGGEPGIGQVPVTLSGGPGGTILTNPDGSYKFKLLIGGGYTVAAPAAAGTLARSTPSPLSVALGPGENRTDVNFGYVSGGISGFAYSDTNHNSVRDTGEAGIGGAVITLTGVSAGTTTTLADGSYQFTDLAAGSYNVSSPALAGGKNLSTTSPLAVTLAMGETRPNVNFGYVSGGISGFAYSDTNHNNVRDSGEAGIAGAVITLTGVSAGTMTTAADGSYTFTNLTAGNYSVSSPALAGGKNRSTPSPLAVTLAVGETRPNVNFGYATGAISGFAYADTNNNGVRDAGEAGIGGAVITLSGVSAGTMTTAADGSYQFTALLAGSYSVSAPATAGGKNRSTPSPLAVTLAIGETRPNVNFGYVAPPPVTGSLSGYTYKDFNNNSLRDAATEPGIPGVKVSMPGFPDATTDATGFYSFSNLPAATYSVSAPATAAGLTRTTPSPLSVVVAGGGNSPNNNFGYRETTMASCPYTIVPNSNPTRVVFTVQDTGGGLTKIETTQNTNFKVLVSPPSPAWSATNLGATGLVIANFNPPTTAVVTVTATRVNQSSSASLTFLAKDAFNNVLNCDPTVVTVGSIGNLGGGHQGFRKMLREEGREELTVIENVPQAERYVTIQNNTPGLNRLDILVNGQRFAVRNLENGELQRIDVGAAMQPGNTNRFVIVGRGRPRGTAEVTIADIFVQ